MEKKEKYNNIREKLKKTLKKSRYEHTIGVEYTAAALAMRYDVGIDKARMAGLLHDCAKNISDDKQLKLCKKYGLEISEVEQKLPYLLHAKLGAYLAKNLYEIDDTYILDAIRYHTTGRANMTMLDKIIFTADYIEPGRNKAPRLSQIRKLSFEDIDQAMLLIFEDTINYVKSDENGPCIDSTTLEAYEYLKQNIV